MKKWIAAAVVVVLVIAAAVWYKAGSAPAVAETPETATTPAPTATPEPTPAATPTATPEPPPTATPANTEETEEVVDKDSPEYIKKEYHQEGKTLTPALEADGCYVDEDGIIRNPDGSPVTFDDPTDLPEGFTYEAGPNQETLENSQKAQEGAEKFASGQDEELNAVIDQLIEEGYYN
ncbi:MAG TPA: hypothetical protein H9811_05920 [Candidatus Gemmiger excrementigallinarum]|uniref:Uncharacterized protein n=1 Tax=Candidatus Gemmiger excrementigallinarum TaxID=2838609 RepID=A0A9D2J9Y8_9FIRM|nr:hypothetical protein [Candidatus Gemmiger excrementigallinarum]